MSDAGVTPRVSVCIPTYNYADFVDRAIASVLAQSYGDFELIVVDDASQDSTAEVVQHYLDDSRVQFIQNSTNRGLFNNFNFVAGEARGEYLKFLCADDWLHPEFLTDTVALLDADPDLSLVTTSGFQADEDDRVWGIDYAPFTAERVDRCTAAAVTAAWHYPIGRPTNTIARRKAFVDAGGFDLRFAPPGDLHLWLKMLRHSDLGVVREPRCFIRVHESKSHHFANDPTEAVFEVWKDAAAWADSPVGPELLELALYREARRTMQYVIWELGARRFSEALRIYRYVTRHVASRRLWPRFLLDAPGLAHDYLSVRWAKRSGHMVVRNPRPRRGDRLVAKAK